MIGFEFTSPSYSVIIEQKKQMSGSDGNHSEFERHFTAFRGLEFDRNSQEINANEVTEHEWTLVRDIEQLDSRLELIGVLPLNHLSNQTVWYKNQTIIIFRNDIGIQYCVLHEV